MGKYCDEQVVEEKILKKEEKKLVTRGQVHAYEA
jgi:hypothetical protein